MPKRLEVDIDGRRLSLSNLDKVFYPETGFTKGQVIDYYTRIAPVLLGHLRGRPLTLKRYPDGVTGPYFYEKQCPRHRPDWVATAPVWSRHNSRTIDFCLADDLADARVAGQPRRPRAAHLARARRRRDRADRRRLRPRPGPPATIVECAEVALRLREAFEHLGLEAFPKTSGSKGMQVYVPLNTPATYAQTKPFAHGIAQVLERRHPELVVSDMKKTLRTGKVLVDWSQNDEHKTTVNVYSLRARERPTVSTPLPWEEVEGVLESGDPEALAFTSDAVLARVAEHGDLFGPVIELEQELPTASSAS